MHRRMLTFFVLAMTAMTLLTPALASAQRQPVVPPVIHETSYRTADIAYTFKDGCFEADVQVLASDFEDKEFGAPDIDGSLVQFFATGRDVCQQELLFDIFGYTGGDTDGRSVEIDHALLAGTATGMVTVLDRVSGTQLPLSLNLSWRGGFSHVVTSSDTDTFPIVLPDGTEIVVDQTFTDRQRSGFARGSVTLGEYTIPIVGLRAAPALITSTDMIVTPSLATE